MASSGLIAAGVFNNLHGTMGLAGWQWLFIIESATEPFSLSLGRSSSQTSLDRRLALVYTGFRKI
jgi:hypothetical protein